MSRKKTLANGKLRPAVARGRAKRRAAKETERRTAWLAQFKPGDRERFFNHVDLSQAVFLAGFARETGLDRFEAAALLERVGNERGWRKLRTLDRVVVGIAPPRARVAAIAELRAEADRLESQTCTGLGASWCPVHGDCTCERDEEGEPGEFGLDSLTCPLHGFESSHAAASLA